MKDLNKNKIFWFPKKLHEIKKTLVIDKIMRSTEKILWTESLISRRYKKFFKCKCGFNGYKVKIKREARVLR